MGWRDYIRNPGTVIRRELGIKSDDPIMTAFDPGGTVLQRMSEGGVHSVSDALDPGYALHAPTAQQTPRSTPTPRTPYMGARGNTISLGGNSGGRTYAPNPFAQRPASVPPPPQQGGAMGFRGPMPQAGQSGVSTIQPDYGPPPQMQNQMLQSQALRNPNMGRGRTL